MTNTRMWSFQSSNCYNLNISISWTRKNTRFAKMTDINHCCHQTMSSIDNKHVFKKSNFAKNSFLDKRRLYKFEENRLTKRKVSRIQGNCLHQYTVISSLQTNKSVSFYITTNTKLGFERVLKYGDVVFIEIKVRFLLL